VERCWASPLGDCDGPLSDEHIITAGLLPEMVNVSGLDWCKGGVRAIPRDRLVRRILCRGHNGRLEPRDKVAIRSARSIDEWQRLKRARAEVGPPRRWTLSRFDINGIDLERWLVKTTINYAFDTDVWLGPTATEPGKPPTELVRVAFGKESFCDKRGLYVLSAQGYTANISDRLSLVPWSNGEVVNGMAINFRGFVLMLCLVPTGLDLNQVIDTPLLAMDPEQKVDRMKLNPMYHPKAFVSK
jgi:hypothetical protein